MKIKICLLLFATGLSFSCQQNKLSKTKSADTPEIKKGMIKVTILYPNGDGKTFDMNYYTEKHMPLVASLLGDSLKLIKIDKGIANGRSDAPVPFLAIGYLYFDRLSAYQNSFGPNATKIRDDIPHFTNIQPIVQISEVLQ
ncbi:MAG TPA: EthD family reductase [Chitinophagaceae bacterium]|jgi:uncharacterized protein (TIGR02118 family)